MTMQPNSAEINNIAGGSSLPQPPSMEELLASIRRIISEESSGKSKAAEQQSEPNFNDFNLDHDSGMPQILPDAPSLHADPRLELSRSPMNANDPWAVEETEAFVLSSSMMEQMGNSKSNADTAENYSNGQFMPGGRREPHLDHFPKAVNPSLNPPINSSFNMSTPTPTNQSRMGSQPNTAPSFTETAKPASLPQSGHEMPQNIAPDHHFSEPSNLSQPNMDGLSALDVGFSSTIADSDFFGTTPEEHARAAKQNNLAKPNMAAGGASAVHLRMNGQSPSDGQNDGAILLSKLATDNKSPIGSAASSPAAIDLSQKTPPKAANLSFGQAGIAKSKPSMDINFADLSGKPAKIAPSSAPGPAPQSAKTGLDDEFFGVSASQPSHPNNANISKSAFSVDFDVTSSSASEHEAEETESESSDETPGFKDRFAPNFDAEIPLGLNDSDKLNNQSVGENAIKSGAIGSPDMVMMPSSLSSNDGLDALHLTQQDIPPLSAPLDSSLAASPMMLRENAPDPLMKAANIGMESVPASTLGYDAGASVMSDHAIEAAARAFAKLQNVDNGNFERTRAQRIY